MNIELDMPVGTYRELTPKEFSELSDLIKDSKKTFQPRQNRKPKR
jgi:23S rRNA pseudouridine2604 synthase